LQALISWWNKREENERAWKVPTAEVTATGCNLDRKKSARQRRHHAHPPPEQLADDICEEGATHRGNHGQRQGAGVEGRQMSSVAGNAVSYLLKRQPAKLVAATGIFFDALSKRHPQSTVGKVLESHRAGVWGNKAG
jgi:hypothetical protein